MLIVGFNADSYRDRKSKEIALMKKSRERIAYWSVLQYIIVNEATKIQTPLHPGDEVFFW